MSICKSTEGHYCLTDSVSHSLRILPQLKYNLFKKLGEKYTKPLKKVATVRKKKRQKRF